MCGSAVTPFFMLFSYPLRQSRVGVFCQLVQQGATANTAYSSTSSSVAITGLRVPEGARVRRRVRRRHGQHEHSSLYPPARTWSGTPLGTCGPRARTTCSISAASAAGATRSPRDGSATTGSFSVGVNERTRSAETRLLSPEGAAVQACI